MEWSHKHLENEFKDLARSAEEVELEFAMGSPDEGKCDQLLKSMWSRLGNILQTRKREGWPR